MEFCTYEKKGHVAYVTITRPEVMNALHAHANAELSDVFDDFAKDDEMWVAVLTGQGERAFSAGNDLKYTAYLDGLKPDERPQLPRSAGGFGGLTSRFETICQVDQGSVEPNWARRAPSMSSRQRPRASHQSGILTPNTRVSLPVSSLE